VLFGSRNRSKAEAVADGASDTARAGDFDGAAAFGEVVLYTVRDALPSALLRASLTAKIVIDCNNSAILGLDTPDPAGRAGFHFAPPVPSLAERLAADVPGARIVKAFNTIPASVLELEHEQLLPYRVSVFLCSDDAQAKSIVRSLAEELGLVGVDSGELERAQLVEGMADFVRFQILGMGWGPFPALSLNRVLDPPRHFQLPIAPPARAQAATV
jgi:predicted dinucleotide-binding enzyme